jgi:fructose 1,6-bisphosphatase
MRKMYVAFSHQLTDAQTKDAAVSLNVKTFVYPSADIQKLISNIPDDMEARDVRALAWDVFNEAMENNCDYLFIAGQVELVHYALEQVKKSGYIQAINSITKRKSIETEVNGVVTKTSVFEHVRWREII